MQWQDGRGKMKVKIINGQMLMFLIIFKQHGEFFLTYLVSEWTLKIYMYNFGFEYKHEALERIRQQEMDYPYPVDQEVDKKEKPSRKRR